ncbi:MAG: HupE/UreJ family protein [Chitinophagales bacterium]
MKHFLFIALLTLHLSAFAHESRPLYIQIQEQTDFSLSVQLNIPNTLTNNNLPYLILPENYTENETAQTVYQKESGYLSSHLYQTSTSELKGQNIEIKFPLFNPAITTIVQLQLQNEALQTFIISPQKNSFFIPTAPKHFEVIKQYTRLGIEHIWAGIDHLLFLVCLLIIAGFSRKLFWTITGFTFAHSITLVLSTLGWVQLPIAPVEACIALSIIFLCYEIIHHHSTQTSLTYRYPVLVSSSFGLLHGFGFASVLGEIGLPQSNLVSALLFFNIGVEIGQLLFLMTVLVLQFAVLRFFAHRFKNFSHYAFKTAVYGVGILASFWFFDRLF